MKHFQLTRHAETRLRQRGRRPQEIAFVIQHGTQTEAGIMLTAKDAAAIEQEARMMIAMATRLRNILVPCEGDTVKTVFRASPNQQRCLL